MCDGRRPDDGGYDLPARFVIHVVGPVYHGGGAGEAALLRSAYESALRLAAEAEVGSIAFPCISTGVYGYPQAEACRIAVDTVSEWLDSHELPRDVVFCCFGADDEALYRQRLDAWSSLGVLTWNINFRNADAMEPLESIINRLDVVTLQEVKREHFLAVRGLLADLGLNHAHYTGHDSNYGNLIAARYELEAVPSAVKPWPELLGHAIVHTPAGNVRVLTVHAPNGSGNGWAKIETLVDLQHTLSGLREDRVVLTGDFNEPQLTRVLDGRVVTWGQEATGDEFATWSRWRSDLPGDTGDRWDDVASWFFEPERSGLHHVHWEIENARVDLPETHVSGGVSRSFDHVFVSDGLAATRCEYLAQTRPLYSDHTAVLATIRVVPK